MDSRSGAVVGKRYHCLENLCSLAVQCNIPPEQVEKDCRMVAERLEQLTVSDDNHFTEYDILCALRTYYTADENAYRRRIDFISKKTGIALVPNKRNGRKQEVHIKTVNAMRKFRRDELGEDEYKNNGRPKGSGTAEEKVMEWRRQHPAERKIECHRDTGLSRVTIDKWWESM